MRGESMPSIMSPESGQTSTSLMPGSEGCTLVKPSPEDASHTRTMCLSALITLRPDSPAERPAHAQISRGRIHGLGFRG